MPPVRYPRVELGDTYLDRDPNANPRMKRRILIVRDIWHHETLGVIVEGAIYNGNSYGVYKGRLLDFWQHWILRGFKLPTEVAV